MSIEHNCKYRECHMRPNPTLFFEKKPGVYTCNPLEVFDMNRKGEAVFRFSRRSAPINLFSYIRYEMRMNSANKNAASRGPVPLKNDDGLKMNKHAPIVLSVMKDSAEEFEDNFKALLNPLTYVPRRCSTPIDVIAIEKDAETINVDASKDVCFCQKHH